MGKTQHPGKDTHARETTPGDQDGRATLFFWRKNNQAGGKSRFCAESWRGREFTLGGGHSADYGVFRNFQGHSAHNKVAHTVFPELETALDETACLLLHDHID